MFSTIAQAPAALAIRGVLALLLGVFALMLPVTAFLTLVIAFGAFALVDGVSALVSAITRPARDGRGWLVIEGITGIVIGLLTFVWPGRTAVVLIAFIAAWALITGIMKIVLAVRLRRVINGEWLLILSGAASVIFAGLMIGRPFPATLALVWVLGIYALILGGLLIALSVRVAHWEGGLTTPARPEERRAA